MPNAHSPTVFTSYILNKFEHVFGEGGGLYREVQDEQVWTCLWVGLYTEKGGQGWGLAQAEPGIEPCTEGARTGVLYRDLPEETAWQTWLKTLPSCNFTDRQ